MAQEIPSDLELRRCISEPVRVPLQQRHGPPATSLGEGEHDKNPSDTGSSAGNSSRPYVGVSEIGARAMQRIPYLMHDSDLNLKLGLLFAPPGVAQGTALGDIDPLALAVPGNPKPFLAVFNEDVNISLIRESFYNEYFAPGGTAEARSIPTEIGILHYTNRSIVKFNKDSPLYIQEMFTEGQLFDVNREGSMQAVGLTMIAFCLPHDNSKTHWIQALVVRELFPWNRGLRDDIMAVITPREFARGITMAQGTRGIPMLYTEPLGLYMQDGYLQVYTASKRYEMEVSASNGASEDIKPGDEGRARSRRFAIGIWFSEYSAFNSNRNWDWNHDTRLRDEPLGDVIAVLTTIRRLMQLSELRGIMRKVKGISIHISHAYVLSIIEALRKDGAEQFDFKEVWHTPLLEYFKQFEKLGWPIKFRWVGYAGNSNARQIAENSSRGMTYEQGPNDHEAVEKACDDLRRSGVFDISGIPHDENTPIIKVIDADWENMRVPGFLTVRYEEPFDSLMRRLEIAEAEHDPHYNNEATPEEDIFNEDNYPH
ncbi:hypothetical protein ABW19_dt0206723 [Dactylella cylindrospora]|nr:hypothetical protein ABW19_dt0206723 [Dactylella cylindrospora]